MIRKWCFPFLIAVLVIAGCGPKPPRPLLPAEVTIPAVLDAIGRQARAIETFSGWSRVRARSGKDEETTTAVITYRRPDQFKVALLGFGGAELAEIASREDSVIVYIPYYNGFITTPRGVNPLSALMPELDIDLERMLSIISGPTLPPDALERYNVTLNKWPHEAEIILERQGMRHRYLVRGPQMLVVEETVSFEGGMVWHVVRSSFTTVNEIPYPKRILLEDEHRSLRFEFTCLSINSELPPDAFDVMIPDDAQRLRIQRQ